MASKTCGQYGGRNAAGQPCGRPAGDGTEAMVGPCSYHRSRAPATSDEDPDPPADLSVSSRRIWDRTVSRWRFSPPELEVLAGALRWRETAREALDQVREDGPVTVNPDSGNPKQHPALSAAQTSYREFRLSVKQLGLEEKE